MFCSFFVVVVVFGVFVAAKVSFARSLAHTERKEEIEESASFPPRLAFDC